MEILSAARANTRIRDNVASQDSILWFNTFFAIKHDKNKTYDLFVNLITSNFCKWLRSIYDNP